MKRKSKKIKPQLPPCHEGPDARKKFEDKMKTLFQAKKKGKG